MNRSSISLILCLCAAAFCFQAISGVGIGVLEIPLKCYMRLDYGDGKQMITRYHYFDKTSRCRGFMYSGQNGNENNFKSLKECMRVCHGKGSEGDVISPNRMMTTAASSKIPASASVSTEKRKITIRFVGLHPG